MTTPVEALLGQLLTGFGNQTLKLDTLSEARLAPLAGKVIRLNVVPPGRGPARPFTLSVEDSAGSCRLLIEPGAADAPHVIVEGTLPDLTAHLLDLQPGAGGAAISISGDESLLADLAALFAQFQPDLGEPLASLMGERAADTLLGAAEAALAGLKSAAQALGNAAREGSRQSFVAHVELEDMLDRMSALQLRVDRLAARLDVVHRQRADGRERQGSST